MIRKHVLLVGIIVFFMSFTQTFILEGAQNMIADGKKVKIDYTLTVDGSVVDTSEGKEPLAYTQGEHMIIAGLEKELEGMKAGDSKHVTIQPEDAYGVKTDEALKEIPKSQFPQNITPEVGLHLAMQTPQGQQIPVSIAEIKDETIVLDFNHPLAGKELNFDVTVVSVEDKSSE